MLVAEMDQITLTCMLTAFEFSPHTNAAYAGNDGGLYKYMDNLNTWVDISDGLAISQFYNLGVFNLIQTEELLAHKIMEQKC